MKTLATAGLLLILTTGNALADSTKGQKLHDAQCMKCHDTSVYTRPERFVSSLDALKKQVRRCHQNVGAKWSDEELADVEQYLDETFYKFK